MKLENVVRRQDNVSRRLSQAQGQQIPHTNDAANLTSWLPSVEPLPSQPTEQSIWQQLKHALLRYCLAESNDPHLSNVLIQLGAQYTKQLANTAAYTLTLAKARVAPQDDHTWLSHCLTSDAVLQVNLETVFGTQPTPMHSYSGPSGLILVVEGRLKLNRFTEHVNALTDCSLFSKLVRQTSNHLQPAQATLFNQNTGTIVELQAQQNRCIFLNIFIKDKAQFPHYYYYPTYHSPSANSVFTRRVKLHSC